MKKRHVYILLSLLTLWLFVGCNGENGTKAEPIEPVNGQATGSETPTSEATSAENTAVPSTPTQDSQMNRLTPAATPEVETVPKTAVPSSIEEVPEAIMTAVYEDLTATTNVQRTAITVARAETIVWSDGSLGCPQPGQVYTQAPVTGYLIVLEVNGQTYSYHAAKSGTFILCPNSLPQSPPSVGTPSS